MSSPGSPSGSLSTFCEIAKVRVVGRRLWQQPIYKLSHVLVSSRICWKVANEDLSNQPQSLVDFRNASSLELVRLRGGSWEDVNEAVMVDNYEGMPRITVTGRLHGHEQLRNLFLVREVRIEIVANTREQHDVWASKIRARIAPWDLLHQEIKAVASRAPSSGIHGIEMALGGVVTGGFDTNQSSVPVDKVEGKFSDFPRTLKEQMEKLSIVDELSARITASVGQSATLAKLVASAECVSETAELLTDHFKCVVGVSTIFQLVSLSAVGVLMCAEANRGRRMLPVALSRITILLRFVLENLVQILKPCRVEHDTEIDVLSDQLKQAVVVMDRAETQLLRGRFSQIMHAEDVNELERKIAELKFIASLRENNSRISAIDEKLHHLEEERKLRDEELQKLRDEHKEFRDELGEIWDGLHHVRPLLSSFFSGRARELAVLRSILEKWGSAVITQYGGVGKTELMNAFADRAERDNLVPGGVFWVTADGGLRDVTESLATLAEKLTQRKLGEEERRNSNMVIAALKQGLDRRQGRWLLCLDNADDSRVSGILNEVCGMTRGRHEEGWVVVTSRQGQPQIWSRMKSEQKLVLEPLCVEDGMVALWRQVRKIRTDDADDDEVINAIKELGKADASEYEALKELCGDEDRCNLGGLPLALVQAGTYIARFHCSFREYLNMFNSANRTEEMQEIMKNTVELKPIRESQRSIWTTWKISVEKLSVTAHTVLQGMAMLGQGGIMEVMVKRLFEAITANGGDIVTGMFEKVIIEELMHGSSLIWCDEEEERGKRTYGMHRLVRRFVLNDMGRGSAKWNEVYSLALPVVRESIQAELEKEGKSFYDLPDVFNTNHRELSMHSLALVHHFVIEAQSSEGLDVSVVENIHSYSGKVMRFMGKFEAAALVWEQLLSILHQQSAKIGRVVRGNKPHPAIASSLNNLGNVYEMMGKLEEALEKCEESLEMFRAVHGNKPHPDIATSLNNLGNVYSGMGELEKALEKYEDSLEMRRAVHGNKPHPDIATSLNNIGLVYEGMGRLEEALENYEQGLEMRRAVYGNKPHPAIASSLNNLGNVYEMMGKLEKALEKCEESLEMFRAVHGNKPHPDIATSLNNLGSVYEMMGELEKALEKCEESLEMFRAVHGNKPHPDIATSLNNLGNVYKMMGELEKALEKYEESLEMSRAVYGQNSAHPAIASSLNNLGMVYRQMGMLDKSLEKHEESLEMELAIYGHDQPHPAIASSLNNLGKVYEMMGELEKALEKYEQSLEMSRAVYGQNNAHPDTAVSLWNIGLIHCRTKNMSRAAEFLEQSLEMLQTVHGRNSQHPLITAVLSDLAEVYGEQGR